MVGPTAAGKTRFALDLAKRLGGEIVSADMGQLYRLLDAGTAKPEGRWSRKGGKSVFLSEGVPYHLVDVLDPSQETDAASYARLARRVLEDIRNRGRQPILAGGAGLYLRALLEGFDPLPPGDPALRSRLLASAERLGRDWLHSELGRRDPASASAIPAGNLQRVVRALEICELTGRPASELRRGRRAPSSPVLYLGLDWSPEALRERIRLRAAAMFPLMLKEVAGLVPGRFSGAEPGFRCLGYPQALACLRKEATEEEALEEMVRATNAYAKRQRTWFRGQTPARWLDGRSNAAEVDLWKT